MATLFLDKEGADGVITQVTMQIDNLKDAAAVIHTQIADELPRYWRGDSANSTAATYESDYRDFLTTKVPNMVTELNKYIQDCVTAIKDLDTQLGGH